MIDIVIWIIIIIVILNYKKTKGRTSRTQMIKQKANQSDNKKTDSAYSGKDAQYIKRSEIVNQNIKKLDKSAWNVRKPSRLTQNADSTNQFVQNARSSTNQFVQNARSSTNQFVQNARSSTNQFVQNARSSTNQFAQNVTTVNNAGQELSNENKAKQAELKSRLQQRYGNMSDLRNIRRSQQTGGLQQWEERTVNQQNKNIFERAYANAQEDFLQNTCDQFLPQTGIPYIMGEESELMHRVQDLIVMGYQGNMRYERDFIGEAENMLNRFL